jgi:hypothetical protein
MRRLQETDSGLQLMRRDNLPFVAAALSEHLSGQQRVRTVAELLTLLEEDLFALRDRGFDLPRSAQEYLADWIAARLVIRRPGAGREETVEMSPSALSAIRFLSDIEVPRSSVTSSRLTNVADLISGLARDTDPDPTSYLEALHKEKAAIEQAIADVDTGRYQPISAIEARERLAEIIHLANEVPEDFVRVSDDLERLNKELREQIINQAGTRGSILDQVFAGVENIDNSEAGRSFNAFYSLVLDPERANAIDDTVDAVLSREFAAQLTDREIVMLRRWLSALQAESSQVRSVITSLARSLRRFVESHAYREHRRLAEAIAEAKRTVLEASRSIKPNNETGYELPASSIPISSISSWRPLNPADTQVRRQVRMYDEQPLDLEQLRRLIRLSEIDFAELRLSVAETLNTLGSASIGDVLMHYPATQGLASIIGLLVLADTVGIRSSDNETVTWRNVDGQERSVSIRRHIFQDVPDNWRGVEDRFRLVEES